jgi:hypothetical protein
MIIKDKLGNESVINKKPIELEGFSIVIGKKTPDESTTSFFHAYETTTGHWVGLGKTQDEAIEFVKSKTDHIKKILETTSQQMTGLFA